MEKAKRPPSGTDTSSTKLNESLIMFRVLKEGTALRAIQHAHFSFLFFFFPRVREP